MSYVAQSGLDSLLEALRQSGMNTDGVGSGTGASDSASSGPQTPGSGSGSGSGSGAGAGASGSRGGVGGFGGFPFGGFGGFGGAGSGGGRGHGGSGSGDGGDGGHGGPTVDFEFLANDFHLPSKKWLALIIVLALLVIAGAYWWFHPAINIHSTDFWGFVFVVILLPLFLVFWMRSKQYQTGTKEVTKNEGKAKTFRILSFVPVAVVALVAIGALMSMAIFPGNAEKYSNVLKTDTLEFAQDIKEVNYSEIPVIDRDSAILLGNREMGSIPEYVSQFEVSNLYSQINYQGTPVRVSPLGYADLFKWFTNREGGIPAYALVNMTTQDAEIVRLEDSPIYYSQSEPLVRNIDRHVQLSYPFYMFGEKSFEIDEDGHPWWICPVKDFTIGLFGGETISRVVLCDATTGETQDLAVADCPEWVDRVFPAELLIQQYNWWGLQQRLAELVPRPGGRGAHDARHRWHAGLQLHRQGRRRVGLYRRHLGHGRQLHHRLRAGEPAHPGSHTSTASRALRRTRPCSRRGARCRTCATPPRSRCSSTCRTSRPTSWP